jgi:hypothetical protein
LTIGIAFIDQLTLPKKFVMHAIVEKGNKHYQRDRKNHESRGIEPSKLPFKVVVNNYRQQEKELPDKIDVDTDKTMSSRQVGLPSQPTSYLKYPEYDWL